MIDTYYRIKGFHELGPHIHLHCFSYGRQVQKEIDTLCETVYYYPRKSGILQNFSSLPYIVTSRRSKELLKNLLKNDFPILFDGLHTAFYCNHPALSGRRKYVRAHNIEHQYYKSLGNKEAGFLKKLYFHIESLKLKRFESVLANVNKVITVSDIDQEYFNTRYHNSLLIPSFHPFNKSESLTGIGEYILFQGDLSVNENAAISDFLISEVFSKVPYRCIIAGKNPPPAIISRCSKYPNIRVISNPNGDEMLYLIKNAQINLIPALTSNGLKLKLLYALYAGRHCMVNTTMTKGNFLGNLCQISDSGEEMIENIHQLMKMPFTEEMILIRDEVLSEHYNNHKNAGQFLDLIFRM